MTVLLEYAAGQFGQKIRVRHISCPPSFPIPSVSPPMEEGALMRGIL